MPYDRQRYSRVRMKHHVVSSCGYPFFERIFRQKPDIELMLAFTRLSFLESCRTAYSLKFRQGKFSSKAEMIAAISSQALMKSDSYN